MNTHGEHHGHKPEPGHAHEPKKDPITEEITNVEKTDQAQEGNENGLEG